MIRRPQRRYNLTPTRRATGSRVTIAVGASNRLARRPPITITAAVLGSAPLGHPKPIVFTFDQPVNSGTAGDVTADSGAKSVSVTITGGNTAAIVFADVATPTEFTWPFEATEVRNRAAGYVLPLPTTTLPYPPA